MLKLTTATAAAFIVSATLVQAAEIDFSKALINPDGLPYTDCAKWEKDDPRQGCVTVVPVTLGKLAYTALNIPEQGINYEQIVKRGLLSQKIYKGQKLNVSKEDIDLIKKGFEKLGSSASPYLIVKALEILDPGSLK